MNGFAQRLSYSPAKRAPLPPSKLNSHFQDCPFAPRSVKPFLSQGTLWKKERNISSTLRNERHPLPRIELDLPDCFSFRAEIDLRNPDFDHNGRLSNHALLSLMNEARIKFFLSLGYRDGDVDGAGTVLADGVMTHEAPCVAGDSLGFEITAGAFSRTGCDLFYRITNTRTGALVARAKTALEFVDRGTDRPVEVPGKFRNRFV